MNRRASLGLGAAALVGVAGAALLVVLTGVAGAGPTRTAADSAFVTATHFPPRLRAAGEPAQLRYDIYCLPPGGDSDQSAGVCDGGGTVYVRPGASGRFTAVPLQLDPNAVEGRYYADVPAAIANAATGFQYYAVLEDRSRGLTTTLPAGGASAPQWSWRLGQPATVDLGTHTFGATRQASARVVSASWGDGPGQVGLEDGADAPAGASSFDVVGRTVYLLDEANKRILRYPDGDSPPSVVATPAVSGVIADLAVAANPRPGGGSYFVLEEPHANQPSAVLDTLDASGATIRRDALPERVAPQVRLAGSTVYVSQYPSSQWMPAAVDGGARALTTNDEVAGGVPGRPLASGGEIAVESLGDEIRVALVDSAGTVRRAYAVRSATPIADVQLADVLPSGKLVLVFSVYTETQHEYQVLVLGATDTVTSFAVPADEYAESSPLSRFRLSGTSLYRLGSTASGPFVDRYDLGVS